MRYFRVRGNVQDLNTQNFFYSNYAVNNILSNCTKFCDKNFAYENFWIHCVLKTTVYVQLFTCVALLFTCVIAVKNIGMLFLESFPLI